jgi:anti-sigma regulatory factor (Ser/Thr protein kinase)
MGALAAATTMPSQEVTDHSYLELAALKGAVPSTRLHTRLILHEWGLLALSDTAELLASELVTNAVLASDRLRNRADLGIVPVIRLWVTASDAAVYVHVWDSSHEMPVRREVAIDEESGRGLILVEALSKEWGVYRRDGGKVVWAMIAADR